MVNINLALPQLSRILDISTLAIGFLALAGCSGSRSSTPVSNLPVLPVTLPNGTVIHAEVASTPAEQSRGLQFRDELAPDRGMIFHFTDMRERPFWMYHTRIPLDVLWIDGRGQVVEMSTNIPPCESEIPRECPIYGGKIPSKFVLELAAGQAEANGLRLGDRIGF